MRFSESFSDAANRSAIAFNAELERYPLTGQLETAPGLTTVLVLFDQDHVTVLEMMENLNIRLRTKNWAEAEPPENRKRHIIPAYIGDETGPDLEIFLETSGWTKNTILQLLSKPSRVMTIGFRPGQPYLWPSSPLPDIPRKTHLSPVSPGDIVSAIGQMIIFSANSPTGWWRLGKAACLPFDIRRTDPFAFKAGDEILLEPTSKPIFEAAWQRVEAGQKSWHEEAI